MAESVLIVATGDLILRKSHTLTDLSSEPDTTLSSRVKTVDVTLLEKKHLVFLAPLSSFKFYLL